MTVRRSEHSPARVRASQSRRRCAAALQAVIAAGAVSCAPITLERQELVSGERLVQLADRATRTVILVYDPSDCFNCSGELAHWLQLRPDPNRAVLIVLSREPRKDEMTQLITHRIPVAGILAPGLLRQRPQTPAALLLTNGVPSVTYVKGDAAALAHIQRELGLP